MNENEGFAQNGCYGNQLQSFDVVFYNVFIMIMIMNQQHTQTTCDAGSGNRTWATAVGGKPSHHCAIPTYRDRIYSIFSL